jgi:hypothetical protein
MMAKIQKQKLELRVVIFDGQRHALYLSLSLFGQDIYTTLGGSSGRNLIRHSYHWSGETHLRVAERIVSRAKQTRLQSISGRARIAVASQSLSGLDWSYKFKNDSKTRRNIIIHTRILADIPSFTVEVWAIEPKQDNKNALMSEFEQNRILTHAHINWTNPEFVIVVWTLTDQGWQKAKEATGILPTGN